MTDLNSISYTYVQDLVINEAFLRTAKSKVTINLDGNENLTYMCVCAIFALSLRSLYELYSILSTKRALKIQFLLYPARKRFQ
jgi:hypothetical protein